MKWQGKGMSVKNFLGGGRRGWYVQGETSRSQWRIYQSQCLVVIICDWLTHRHTYIQRAVDWLPVYY